MTRYYELEAYDASGAPLSLASAHGLLRTMTGWIFLWRHVYIWQEAERRGGAK